MPNLDLSFFGCLHISAPDYRPIRKRRGRAAGFPHDSPRICLNLPRRAKRREDVRTVPAPRKSDQKIATLTMREDLPFEDVLVSEVVRDSRQGRDVRRERESRDPAGDEVVRDMDRIRCAPAVPAEEDAPSAPNGYQEIGD